MATDHAGIETATDCPDRTVLRRLDCQERRRRTGAVDPDLCGDRLEAGLFGQGVFKAMAAAGESPDGMARVGQRFMLHRSVGLGLPPRRPGWIERDQPVWQGVQTMIRMTAALVERAAPAACDAPARPLRPACRDDRAGRRLDPVARGRRGRQAGRRTAG